jgi:uncharacterized protein (TIGR02118 family)
MVKLIAFFKRRPGVSAAAQAMRELAPSAEYRAVRGDVTPEQFQKHWREIHGPLAAAVPGNRRAVQSRARLGIYRAGRTPAFDGVSLSWFDDEQTLRAAGSSPELARMRADEPSFLAPGRLPFVIAREVEIDVRSGASEVRS